VPDSLKNTDLCDQAHYFYLGDRGRGALYAQNTINRSFTELIVLY
jgi:hypothetical protein